MSSEQRRRSSGPLVVGLALLLALTGCGRKGDPQPPPRKNPERISDLEVRQRGNELILTMSYPTMTTGGLALPGITKLEVFQYTRPAPEFMETPEGELPEADGVDGEEARPLESAEDDEADEPVADESVADEPDTAPMPEADSLQAPAEQEPVEGEPGEEEAIESDEGEGDDAAEEDGVPVEETNPYLKIRIDAKEFDKQAERVVVLQDAELDATVVGGTIEVRLSLEEIPTEPPVAYAFAVETSAGRLRSPRSRTVAFIPLPPPPAPTNLTLSASWQGIALTWTGVEDEMIETAELAVDVGKAEEAAVGEDEDHLTGEVTGESLDEVAVEAHEREPAFEGYRVLRRLAESPGYEEPIATTEPGVTEYLDAGIAYGRTYVYTVTTMLMERPLVESEPAEEQQIEHLDVYPPDTPGGLVALAEAGRVRLLWDAGRARDIAGYLIFVSENGGEQRQLTSEPLAATEFTHQGTVSGITYTYVVRAIDTTGNISEPSEAVTTRAP